MDQRLLYITSDGLLEPLGFSQVVRVVEGLARAGWPYAILSLEKPRDLENSTRVSMVRKRLIAAGVPWYPFPYDWSGTSRAAVENMKTLVREATRLASERRLIGIHARAYHGAVAAWSAWLAYRTPYLFDTRSYWVDERIEESRWFTTPIRLGIARGVEHQLFAAAAGIVTLTELQADDVRTGQFGPAKGREIRCIPTCANFDDFRRMPLDSLTSVPIDIRDRLAGKLTIGIVGSINRSYLVDETLELARRILALRSDAHLLVLSSQREAYEAAIAKAGVDDRRVTIVKAEHDLMPQWLSLIDWGMLLLQPNSAAKRASMPTKLAEFFGCGVRQIHFGCNAEVGEWVRRAGSGISLDAVDSSSLERAAIQVSESVPNDHLLGNARATTEHHFSLRSGIERYQSVLARTFATARRGLASRSEVQNAK